MSMALVCSTGGRSCSIFQRGESRGSVSSPEPAPLLSIHWKDGRARRGAAQVVCARKGISSRTRGGENRGKKGGSTTTTPKEEFSGAEADASLSSTAEGELLGTDVGSSVQTPMPDLPGLSADFWEGSKWDTFGFVVEYLWAFGILFALIACGIAVATYNEGATDFKETAVYKESMQSQELLEEPDSSASDVFEVNPTEVAPSLE